MRLPLPPRCRRSAGPVFVGSDLGSWRTSGPENADIDNRLILQVRDSEKAPATSAAMSTLSVSCSLQLDLESSCSVSHRQSDEDGQKTCQMLQCLNAPVTSTASLTLRTTFSLGSASRHPTEQTLCPPQSAWQCMAGAKCVAACALIIPSRTTPGTACSAMQRLPAVSICLTSSLALTIRHLRKALGCVRQRSAMEWRDVGGGRKCDIETACDFDASKSFGSQNS